ncbi:MAG: hypothetical protein KatS3mg002_0375 [Candidatus Woesearchaeota archaeon]|nr:MAG: hypothetical protein KatS3mg002_0375 [Candidatus Woesearchaeota archaeon]
MSYDPNTIWYNQQLITYFDSYFTGSTLDISLSSSQSTSNNFSPPKINFGINNRIIRRVFAFDYLLISDLLKKAKRFLDSIKNNDFDSKMQFSNFKMATIIFEITKERNVHCTIESSKTDVISVTIPPNIFVNILELLKEFKTNYLTITTTAQNRDLLCNMSSTLVILRNEIKNLNYRLNNLESIKIQSSNEEEFDYEKANEESSPEFEESNSNDISNNSDLDISDIPIDTDKLDTMNDDIMEIAKSINIDLPDINQNINDNKHQPDTFIIPKIFKNISNLESFTASIKNAYSVIEFMDYLKGKIKNDSFKPLDGLDEKWVKDINLLSSLVYLKNVKAYINKLPVNDKIPFYDLPINKEETTIENINLAYEFLIISGYVRIMKTLLSKRTSDAMQNYSLMYIRFRTLTDPFIIPFIKDIDHKIIIDSVQKKFIEMKNNGFFAPYEEILNKYDCKPISESQMELFAKEFVTKGFAVVIPFQEFWKKVICLEYGKKYEYDHIPEIIKTELELIPGKSDLTRENLIQKNNTIPEDILNLYLHKNELDEDKPKRKRRKPIIKYIDYVFADVPETGKDDVREFREKLENVLDITSTVTITDSVFNISVLPDNIQAAIRVWNSLESKNITFEDFVGLVEKEMKNENNLTFYKHKEVLSEKIDFDDISSINLLD